MAVSASRASLCKILTRGRPPETSDARGRRRRADQQRGQAALPRRRHHQGRSWRRYYAAIAPAMVPHVRDRPLNLWRWNTGHRQRRRRAAGDPARRAGVGPARRGAAPRAAGSVCHAVGGEAATLVWLANLNCITPHAWTGRADRPDHPDRLVFDLDPPDEDADSHFPAIRAGARELGALLAELGLAGFAMTSGSRGLHVVAPLRRRARRRRGARASRARSPSCSPRACPARLTTAWRKEKRGGRVLVDVARNTYAQTTVAPVRGARAAGRAGGDAAGVGGARGPRAAPAPLDARERARSASPSAATRGRGSAASPRSLRADPGQRLRELAHALRSTASSAGRRARPRLSK